MKLQIRKFKGEVLGIFPYQIESSNTVLCYYKIGQHSGMAWNLKTTKANEFEINEMLVELKNQGYDDLQLIHRRSNKEYLKAYYKFVKGL